MVDGEGLVGAFGTHDWEDFFDAPTAVEIFVEIVKILEGVCEILDAVIDFF